MGTCDYCGRGENIPFRCRSCGGQFCADHRLPESHNCTSIDQGEACQPDNREESVFLPPQSLKECAYCGAREPVMLFCPYCGNRYCGLHRAPDDHQCPSVQGTQPAMQPDRGPGPRPEKQKPAARAGAALVIIAAVLVTLFAGSFVIGYLSSPPPPAGELPAMASQPPTALPTALLSQEVGTPTPAPVPVAVKNPATIRITPSPSPVMGVVSYPHIISDPARGVILRNYTFPFQDKTVTLTAGVNRSVYNGAKNSEKTVVSTREDIPRRDWAPGYFLAFVDDHHQELFYTDLRSSFTNVRQDLGLTDDEYLELMAVFVQSLEYDTAGARDLAGGNRFPVETFVDGKGVCGDKSLLLAGLLSREGYDVALLLFEPEKHMAVGIRTGRDDYRNTSYAYLETTRLSYVGVVPDNLAGGIVLTTMPQVIPVGNGWKGYTGTPQTVYIRNQSWILRDRILSLESRLRVSGSDVREYNALVDEHNRYVTWYNYINKHEYDRPGAFAYILANETAAPGVPVVTPPPTPPAPVFAACNLSTGTVCPAGSRCCEAEATCYAWCTGGVWSPDDCACRL